MSSRHPSRPTDADVLDAVRELGQARRLRQRRWWLGRDERLETAVDIARMRVDSVADGCDAHAPIGAAAHAERPVLPCPWCDGHGVVAATGIVCRTCGGSGEQRTLTEGAS